MKIAIRIAMALLSNEKIRKSLITVIGIILSPIILIMMTGVIFSAATEQNKTIIEYMFNDEIIPQNVHIEYREEIERVRKHFDNIDIKIEEKNKILASKSLDDIRIKALFLVLIDDDIILDYSEFVNCFVEVKEIERQIITDDETIKTVIETVETPITDLMKIYKNIGELAGIELTHEMITKASEIYYVIRYGANNSNKDDNISSFINSMVYPEDMPVQNINDFVEPVSNWEGSVTSEFGNRVDPFSGIIKGHGALDIAKPKGTPIYAALGGVVIFSKSSNNGYGKYVIIHHSNELATLYAHASKLNVVVGQRVLAGDKIAEVGSTGRSTGNHLHFEVRENGKKVNPRNYLK